MTPEQLLERKRYIGASEAAAACGLSPWQTPLELWNDKTSEEVREEDSDAMRWGRRLEAAVLDAYAEQTGRKPWNRQKRVVSRLYPYMAATLDATTKDRLVEVKTAGRRDEWGEPGSDQVPLHYVAQVTHQMIVTGKRVADIPVLIGGSDFRIYTVEYDQELAELLIERERAFWDCVVNRTPPEVTTLADTGLRWPLDAGTEIQANDEVTAAIERLRELDAHGRAVEQEAERLQTVVRAYMAEAAALKCGSEVLATWKTQGASRLDTAALRKAHPELAATFTRQTTSRVFRLTRERA